MQNNHRTRAALYLRKSHDDGHGKSSRSIKGQREDLKRLAEAHGLTIVAEYNEGAGVSASFLSNTDRPQWEQALAEMGSTYDVLLGWALDRLTRGGMGDVAHLFDLVEQRDARVLTADGFDTSNEASRFMGGFMAEQARQESSNTSKRILRGKEQARARGDYPGGLVGYGLKVVKVDGKVVEVVVDPTEAAVLKFAAEMICDGASYGQAARALNERGDLTATGSLWNGQTLRQTLKRPSVIGHRSHEGEVIRDEDGEPVRYHEPLIPEALWHRLERTVASRSTRTGPAVAVNPPKSLLGGLMVCAECGSSWHQNNAKRKAPYYRCLTCSAPVHSVRRELLDEHVARAALAFLSSLDDDSPIIEEVGRRWLARFTPEQLGRHEAITEELGLLRDKQAELQTAYFQRSTMERDTYERLESRFADQIEALEQELRSTPKPTADLGPLFDLAQASDDPDGDIVGEGSAWAALLPHHRREIIRCLVDTVTIERRERPSDDIEGRTIIEFATESNVVELAARPERRRNASLDLKAAMAATA
tara:strand:- start:2038 stop:3642 length:1605 start_codon:yes stop_codon:yes gene_type:complete